MTPLEGPWAALLALLILLGATIHLLLRRRPERTRRLGLLILAVSNAAMWAVFTADRVQHPEFAFPWSQNWPLHFCTIVTYGLPFAVWFGSGSRGRRFWRAVRALMVFPGSLAGTLALVSPAAIYEGQPVWSLSTLFYVVHGLNAVIPTLLVSLGVFRPRITDALLSILWFFALAIAVLPITLLARTIVDPAANYMYLFGPEDAEILVMLWNLMPIPVVYELPLLILIAPVFVIMWAVQVGVRRIASLAHGADVTATA